MWLNQLVEMGQTYETKQSNLIEMGKTYETKESNLIVFMLL